MPNNTPPPLYNKINTDDNMEKEKNFIFQWLYTTSLYKFCRASFNSTWFSAKRRLLFLAKVVGLFFWATGAVVIGGGVVIAQPPSMGKKIRLNILRLISKMSWLQSLWPFILEWLTTGGALQFLYVSSVSFWKRRRRHLPKAKWRRLAGLEQRSKLCLL